MDIENDSDEHLMSDDEQVTEMNNENNVNNQDNENAGEDEVQDEVSEDSGKVKPKRVIKNPQPKLDALRLMGPRGVVALQSSFKDVKFKGKGYESDDLDMLMKKLEHWAHRLYPKLPFDDVLKQIEKLGTKKPVQNMMKRIRLDMFQSDESELGLSADGVATSDKTVQEADVFDELLGTTPFSDASSNIQNTQPVVKPLLEQSEQRHIHSSPSQHHMLTNEQLEKIERNRRLAQERRKSRVLAEQNKAAEITGKRSLQEREKSYSMETCSLQEKEKLYSSQTDESLLTSEVEERFVFHCENTDSSQNEKAPTMKENYKPHTPKKVQVIEGSNRNFAVNLDSVFNEKENSEYSKKTETVLESIQLETDSTVNECEKVYSEDDILTIIDKGKPPQEG